MIKYSRVLTVVVTVFAVSFMAVAAVAVAVRTDWRERIKKFPSSEISDQQKQLSELDQKITATNEELQAWSAAVEADVKALTDPATGSEAQLEAQLKSLEEQSHKLAEEIEVAARQAQFKLDELKLRREDAFRLQAQYDELVSQKQAAMGEVKRLQDLLVQAKGVLERAQHRQRSLQAPAGSYNQ